MLLKNVFETLQINEKTIIFAIVKAYTITDDTK